MARERRDARPKTANIRKLARKDREDLQKSEIEAFVAESFRHAGFEVGFPMKGATHVMKIDGGDLDLLVTAVPLLTVDDVENITNSRFANRMDQSHLWLIAPSMSADLMETRDRYGCRILFPDELASYLTLRAQWSTSTKPLQPRPSARTPVGKALAVNGDELRTAAITSLLLIQDRLEALNAERPNSADAKTRRQQEIEALTNLQKQLTVIRDLPEQVKNGEVSEAQANKSVKSATDVVREYWNMNSEAILQPSGDDCAIFFHRARLQAGRGIRRSQHCRLRRNGGREVRHGRT